MIPYPKLRLLIILDYIIIQSTKYTFGCCFFLPSVRRSKHLIAFLSATRRTAVSSTFGLTPASQALYKKAY